MRPVALCTFLSALALPALASAQSSNLAAPAAPEPRFSLSIERFASANAVFFSIEDDDEDFKLRSKGITAGGPIANPLSAPRIAFDYLARSGLTLGAGLALGLGDLDSKGSSDVDEGGYNLVMLSPRVGYRIEVAKWLDLTPRAGMTLGWATIQSGEYESCEYYGDDFDDYECATEEGDKIKLFGAVANLEFLATFRLTESFNLLTGLSYDLLVAAKAKEEYEDYDGGGEDSEKFKDGHLSSLQLWLGMGGYF